MDVNTRSPQTDRLDVLIASLLRILTLLRLDMSILASRHFLIPPQPAAGRVQTTFMDMRHFEHVTL